MNLLTSEVKPNPEINEKARMAKGMAVELSISVVIVLLFNTIIFLAETSLNSSKDDIDLEIVLG